MISAPSRLHISLACMGGNPYRRNGGAGLAISGFDTVIVASKAKSISIVNGSNLAKDRWFPEQRLSRLEELLRATSFTEKTQSVKIEIIAAPPQHCGFGSGTALELACLEALFVCGGGPYKPNDLIKYSSRGGTSGVGINTYFSGGFVVDAGQQASSQKFLPSSAVLPSELIRPTLLGRWEFPSWPLLLHLLDIRKTFSGEAETDFFEDNSIATSEQIFFTVFLLTFGLIPSVIESNLESFCSTIKTLQTTHWKAAEWAAQGSGVCSLRTNIEKTGALAVGMSSFGPLLYSLYENEENHSIPGATTTKVHADNIGRKITLC